MKINVTEKFLQKEQTLIILIFNLNSQPKRSRGLV